MRGVRDGFEDCSWAKPEANEFPRGAEGYDDKIEVEPSESKVRRISQSNDDSNPELTINRRPVRQIRKGDNDKAAIRQAV